MRRIRNGLDDFLEGTCPDFVESERQDDRQRKPDDQLVEAEAERIPEQIPEIVGIEETLEMIEAHPWAVHDSFAGDKVLKGNLDAVHGRIVKYKEIQ